MKIAVGISAKAQLVPIDEREAIYVQGAKDIFDQYGAAGTERYADLLADPAALEGFRDNSVIDMMQDEGSAGGKEFRRVASLGQPEAFFDFVTGENGRRIMHEDFMRKNLPRVSENLNENARTIRRIAEE